MRPKNFSIILPTYNEAENIILLIQRISRVCKANKLQPEILVVDDSSPDQTSRKVKSTFRNRQNIRIILRTRNRGLAQSVREGIQKCRRSMLVVMDTDFSHDPQEIPKLLASLEKADVSIGSRFVNKGGMENRTRHYLSLIFNLGIRVYLGVPAHDNLSGFFAIRKKTIMPYLTDKVFTGFGEYFIRLLYNLHKNHKTITEIPVFYKQRLHGKRKSQFIKMFITYSNTVFRLKKGAVPSLFVKEKVRVS